MHVNASECTPLTHLGEHEVHLKTGVRLAAENSWGFSSTPSDKNFMHGQPLGAGQGHGQSSWSLVCLHHDPPLPVPLSVLPPFPFPPPNRECNTQLATE